MISVQTAQEAGEPTAQFCCNTGLPDLGGVVEMTRMSLGSLNSLGFQVIPQAGSCVIFEDDF